MQGYCTNSRRHSAKESQVILDVVDRSRGSTRLSYLVYRVLTGLSRGLEKRITIFIVYSLFLSFFLIPFTIGFRYT